MDIQCTAFGLVCSFFCLVKYRHIGFYISAFSKNLKLTESRMSLAIESGATSSSVLYVPENHKEPEIRLQLGSANFQLLSGIQLEEFFSEIKTSLRCVPIYKLGVGMPGIMSDSNKKTVETVIKKIWPQLKSWWIGNDIETAFACIDGESTLKIMVIAGTGSNTFGTDGFIESKIGGYGHVLGDRGSSYSIAQKALRLALREYEHNLDLGSLNSKKKPDELSQIPINLLINPIMKKLNMNTIHELVQWSLKAHKSEMAGVALLILEEWKAGNAIAKEAVETSIHELAEDCVCLIGKFTKNSNNNVVQAKIGLTGSLFVKNQEFADMYMNSVRTKVTEKLVTVEFLILHETVQGALRNLDSGYNQINSSNCHPKSIPKETNTEEALLAMKILPNYIGLPQTECRNEKSMHLDSMPIEEAIDLMISEEQGIYPEIIKHRESIKILIEKVSAAFKVGGRLFYVGAGTSGRLGILDASECPPTFRSNPECVQGIIAGGFSSVSKAKEGAEDSIIDGMDAINERSICDKDVVIGIAASGRTPFVWGAMYQGKTLGAYTAFITFNVRLEMKVTPDLILAMDLGPEILTGSTRLKCGSATKCILNLLSTIAMVRIGKCFENLMVDLNPANQKLRQRALRIVGMMTNDFEHVDEKRALEILQKYKYDIKRTVLELRQMK